MIQSPSFLCLVLLLAAAGLANGEPEKRGPFDTEDATASAKLELRWQIHTRFSILAFGGVGYALTAPEIALRDERALESMGVSDEDVSRFLTQSSLGISRRHRIVVALEKLNEARGRGNIVQLANSCTSKEQADFLTGPHGQIFRGSRCRTGHCRLADICRSLPLSLKSNRNPKPLHS